jgi:hypothetical protein
LSPLQPFTQFDSKNTTRKSDCAPSAALWALRWATIDGNMPIDPTSRAEIDAFLSELRRDANPQNPPPIALREIVKAYGEVADAHGFPGLKMRRRSGVDLDLALWPAITNGRAALVMVEYGEVRKARPRLANTSADKVGHAIVVFDGRTEGGRRLVTVADPAMNRLTTWPWWVLVRGAETFGKNPHGDGKGEFGVVRKASSPDGDKDEPAPAPVGKVERLERRIERLRDVIDDLQAELASTLEDNTKLRRRVRKVREALAAAKEQGAPEIDAIVQELPPVDDEPEDLPGEGVEEEGAAQDAGA